MKLLVTGATGFIGNHFVVQALRQGHQITVITRDKSNVLNTGWGHQVDSIEADIEQPETKLPDTIASHDALIHLAWSGLPNYQQSFHLDIVLPAHKQFLQTMIEAGTKHILVTGTCLEYGKQEGRLTESMPVFPDVSYAQAKDHLRQWLISMQKQRPFILQWCRLFYTYGSGQHANSLLSQLEQAIENGDPVFNMSGGEQVRDYLAVETVAQYLLKVIERQDCNGILNICSGEPITILELVKNFIAARQSNIELNLGYYPYPDYEAMAFWGDAGKLNQWIIS
ncbi:NAD-dependent epimerase/dehydratase family protein [Methylophaga nitratireducenticrescens]|uniref:UDP-glucose 4-epimerase n=1 Tax=Methylophaga nitratireducenticrescens TaxID=754476 RepID=I1XLC1_METNJ|nr:NAD(P)-dependent oxidoreductase [Methylophaga nitratireducenticrescens]AFI85190.1 NAD(P)-dependent oxidoreductase [Methylophaga nitratireducenticrescens]AUZ85678.1 NAD(P)-dependent oxidoreductase [Methylophaga nitratireducenticrescens]